MWDAVTSNLKFSAVQTVVIDEWRLGFAVKFLQLWILTYIFYDFFYLCSHLEVDSSVAGNVFAVVTDLTDMKYNASPIIVPCKEKLREFVPFNGATSYGSYTDMRLRALPGHGYSTHSETALTINTLIEVDSEINSTCGLVSGTHKGAPGHKESSGCPPIHQPTDYSKVFGNSALASADARCVLDWERYVIMINATFHAHGEVTMKPLQDIYVVDKQGNKVPIQRSKNANVVDWLVEGLPAVRSHIPFRSTHWGLIYMSVPDLLKGRNANQFDPMTGRTVTITLHFANKRPWHVFGSEHLDLNILTTAEDYFYPFRQTVFSEGVLRSSWTVSGIKISVRVTASIAKFSIAKCGIAFVSYSSYLLIGVALVKCMLLYGHLPGLRWLNLCACWFLQCGNLQRTGASTAWYRSLLMRRSPEVSSKQFSTVCVDVDSDESLGLEIDEHTFVITDIKKDSVLHGWNIQHDTRSIAKGDVLVQVNGLSKETPCQAERQLHRKGIIEMTIRHSTSNMKQEFKEFGNVGDRMHKTESGRTNDPGDVENGDKMKAPEEQPPSLPGAVWGGPPELRDCSLEALPQTGTSLHSQQPSKGSPPQIGGPCDDLPMGAPSC